MQILWCLSYQRFIREKALEQKFAWSNAFHLPYKKRPRPVFDRTGQYDFYGPALSFNWAEFRIPELKLINDNFRSVCTERAREIYDFAVTNQKKIILFYSGGIDSTCVLCSFILEVGLEKSKEQIVLCFNEDSITENPEFYKKFIQDQFTTVPLTDFIAGNVSKEYMAGVIVTGDIGLYTASGTISETKCNGLAKIWKEKPHFFSQPGNYKDHLREYYVDGCNEFGVENNIDQICEVMDASALVAGVYNHSFYDYWWWYNFNFRFVDQYFWVAQHCFALFSQPLGADYWRKHYVPFFSNDKFQQWDYTNKEATLNYVMSGAKVRDYKLDLKKLIFQVDGDYDYLVNKDKVVSYPDMPSTVLIDKNFQCHRQVWANKLIS